MFSTNNIEIKTEELYTAYGDCRCCLAKGEHRDVTKEYYYENIKEVYKDIFLQCYNFTLSPHIGISPLICDDCVQHLRDASNFLKMVAETEAQLVTAFVFKTNPDTDTKFVNVPGPHKFTVDVKKENESDNPNTKDTDVINDINSILRNVLTSSHNDDHLHMADNKDHDDDSTEDKLVIDDDVEYVDDNDVYCSSVSRNATSPKDDEPSKVVEGITDQLLRFPALVQPELKQTELVKFRPQNDDYLKEYKGNQSSTPNNTVKPKLELFFNIPGSEVDTPLTDAQVLARNATTIFECSNASAFKPKVKNGYPCYFCRELCKPDTLREHQEKHDKSTLQKILCRYSADKFVIYAEITDLKCTICGKNMRNLIDLRVHLTVQHSKKIYASADRVIPFKLKESDFDCQVCGQMFETFGKVERHMNAHYGSFICEICGNGYITKTRLDSHNYIAHRDENVICEVCKKSFRTHRKYSMHHALVHQQIKKYGCHKCPERFLDFIVRRRHMVKIHGEEPILYKCKFCGRAYDRKTSLAIHEACCQTKPKFFNCALCPYTSVTRVELKEHLFKHGVGSTNHPIKCPVCKKTYVSITTLTTHLKKYH